MSAMNDRISARIYGPDGMLVKHLVGVGAAGPEGNSLWMLVDGRRCRVTGTAVVHVIPKRTPGLERFSDDYTQNFVLYGGDGAELLALKGVRAALPYGLQNNWVVWTGRENGSYYLVVGGTVVVTDPGADAIDETSKEAYSVP